MINIIKNYNTDNYHTYTIKTPTGLFLITYENVGDLFFHCIYHGIHEEKHQIILPLILLKRIIFSINYS